MKISPKETFLELRSFRSGLNNNISKISSIQELKRLEKIDLSNNKIWNIYPLRHLDRITELIMFNNKISDLTPLSNLNNLKYINLGANNITNIKPICKLRKIERLWLVENKIFNCFLLSSLNNLEYLSLGDNGIYNISFLISMKKLSKLHLHGNNIKDISALSELEDLIDVTLNGNKIENIDPLKKLLKIEKLDLSTNLISYLPNWITKFGLKIYSIKNPSKSGVVIYNNPIESPPLEIVKQGKEAIDRYFSKIETEGVDYIYESKLILVGEGSAGKTSLQKRLVDPNAALPRKDKRTRGIEIKDWEFKKEGENVHIAHIWDFGGQDVYFPVHRFFLTENSTFVLLASTRQTHHNFDYWIPTIYQFGGGSPIIIGQTCHDGNKVPWNDLGVYLGDANFNIIKTQQLPYYELNLKNENEGLEAIKQVIENQITTLSHYGKGVPKSWAGVRNKLVDKAKKEACISFDSFRAFCEFNEKDSFKDLQDVKDCCQFLHDIGVVLWYSTNNELSNWIILQPDWAMNAVYRIIDDSEIQNRRGNIIASDFGRLWGDKKYEGKEFILKKMLEIFKIAFAKKHNREEFIIPARLLSIPSEEIWDKNASCLRIDYCYNFMPRGLVNQLSAELSRYINDTNEIWNNAVNFYYEDDLTKCQVVEDFYNRKISITSSGTDARSLMVLVMNAMNNINDEYRGVEPELLVPCTCPECQVIKAPTKFEYNKLLKWLSSSPNRSVTCNESGESIAIRELLYNVGLSTGSEINEIVPERSTIRIFLASSSELKEDRDAFRIFISDENKRLNQNGVFIHLVVWEDFIDAMSQSSLQNEYNKAILDCDIFISLFFTKVGKFTLEEFETAFGNFKDTGKPKIYTYFKNAGIKMNDIKEDDISSKFAFEKRLKELGHFKTEYEDMGDLKYKFKMQLEKVIPSLI